MSAAKSALAGAKRRLAAVVLDEESIGRSNPDVEHERQVAIDDLLEQNSFAPVGHESGPYTLHLSINGNRLAFASGRKTERRWSRICFRDAAAPDRQGLLHDLRQLLSGDPDGDAR